MTYTNQEAFDLCYHHMMCQAKRSAFYEPIFPRSLYRGPNGLMCAIGILIPQSEYSKDLEDEAVHWLITKEIVPSLKGLNPELFHEIQLIHDELPVKRWGKFMRFLAKKYGLKTSRQSRSNKRRKKKSSN